MEGIQVYFIRLYHKIVVRLTIIAVLKTKIRFFSKKKKNL